MTRIRFEDLPSTNTPRNAENLNKLNNVVISPTEPTTGEEVWIDNTNKKIYTKNDNGVYEEFYNEEEHNKVNYSTEEQVIGTWINGKPIYRKIFKDLPLTTGNGVEIAAISNLDVVISLKGMVFHNIYGGQWKPANYYFSSSDYLTMVMSSAGRILVDNSSTSGTITIIVVYTKTTD